MESGRFFLRWIESFLNVGHIEGTQQWSLSKSFISDTIQRFFDTQGQKKSKCAVVKNLVRRNLQTEGRRTKNWEMIGCVCHLIYYQPSLRESSSPSFPNAMFTMMIMMILWRGLCQTINCYGRAQMGHYLPQSPKVRLYLSKRGQWKRSGGLTEVVWTSTLSKFLDFTCIWRKRY